MADFQNRVLYPSENALEGAARQSAAGRSATDLINHDIVGLHNHTHSLQNIYIFLTCIKFA